MGRRSQKSRAGQAKDRAKRAVKESESAADGSAGSSGEEKGGDQKDDDIADETSEAENADDETGGDAADMSSEVEGVDTPEDDDTADQSPEAGRADEGESDDVADKLSEAEGAEEPHDEGTTNKSSEAGSADEPQDEGIADKSSETGSADDAQDEGIANKSSEAGQADEKSDDDTTGKTSGDGDSDKPAEENSPQDSTARDALDGSSADDIAAGYASVEANQSPQTSCPNCKTIFEVTPELLSSTDTRVRCGECLGIFDALANLRSQNESEGDDHGSSSASSNTDSDTDDVQSDAGNEDAASAAQGSVNTSAKGTVSNADLLNVTYADFSLFSADASLPEIEYLDETREVQAFDFDDPGGDDELDETYSETLFAHGPEVDARTAIHETDTSNDEIDESTMSGISGDIDLHNTEQTTAGDTSLSDTHMGDALDELVGTLQRSDPGIIVEQSPAGSWWLRGTLSLLVLSLAAGLYGYREREALQHSRYLRPMLESFCTVIGCTLAEPVDLASLQVLNRSVFSHPKLNNVLVINIGFVNKASFNQRFPILEIRLTDRNGGLVVKNSFEPSDYLDNWQPGDVLDAGKRLDISLNIKDPGNKAMSFELDFR